MRNLTLALTLALGACSSASPLTPTDAPMTSLVTLQSTLRVQRYEGDSLSEIIAPGGSYAFSLTGDVAKLSSFTGGVKMVTSAQDIIHYEMTLADTGSLMSLKCDAFPNRVLACHVEITPNTSAFLVGSY